MVFSLLFAGLTVHAQGDKGITQKQQEKNLVRKEKEDAKAKKKADREAQRRHLSIQSKDVRKRIRKNTKRADRKGSGRHTDPFYKRWFKSRK
jgi:hypothetical protein